MQTLDLPPPDLLAAVYDEYLQFSSHESVLALSDVIGEPNKEQQFQSFCTSAGGMRALDYMRQVSNAILNATFYTAIFATSKKTDFPAQYLQYDPEIPALYVPVAGLYRNEVLYACEATLDLTPWMELQHGHVWYHPTSTAKKTITVQRHRLLSVPFSALLRYSPLEANLLQPAVTAVAAHLWQQSTPNLLKTSDLDRVTSRYLNRGELA